MSCLRSARRLLLLLALASPLHAQSTPRPDPQRAEDAFLAGARLFDQKDLAGAQAQFTRAAQLDPQRREYTLALDLVRQNRISQLLSDAAKASLLAQPAHAASLLAEARALDPNDVRVREHEDGFIEQRPSFTPAPDRVFAPVIQLKPLAQPLAFDLRGAPRTVVTSVAQSFGIKATFDDSVNGADASGAPVNLRFVLEEQPYARSMGVLLHMAHLFAVPLSPTSILVAKDTQENHERLEHQVEESIYIPASTSEQLNEVTNIIKNVFDVRQVVIQPSTGTIVLRAPEETIKAVNYTVADLVDGGAQVNLTLRLYSVDKSMTRSLGLQTPTSVGAFSVPAEAQSLVSNNQTLVQQLISSGAFTPSPTATALQNTVLEALLLVTSGLVSDAKVTGLVALFGGGTTLFGVNETGGATLNFGLNAADTQALDDLSVRVGDHQATKLRVGERYPVTTSTYSSGLSSATTAALGNATINGVSASSLLQQYLGSGSAATIPIIQYEDLGITLTTTPSVLKSGLISLHIELKLEALEGASLNNIPVLTSSVFTSDIAVPDGTTAVMLSNLTSNEQASIAGIPGLGELPGFAAAAGGDRLTETDHSELVLLVTPQIVRRRRDTLATKPYVFHTSVPQEF